MGHSFIFKIPFAIKNKLDESSSYIHVIYLDDTNISIVTWSPKQDVAALALNGLTLC